MINNYPIKIGIYSGSIPSTTFIERLISGLALKGNHILLFGQIKRKKPYKRPIKVVGYSTKLSKTLHLIKYSVFLTIFRHKDKRVLDNWLIENHNNSLNNKVKFYPVLWYKPQIFHIQWAKSLESWMWVQLFGIKLILSLRGAHINYSPITNPQLATSYRQNFSKVDAFHAVSIAIKNEAKLYGAASDKVKVIYSGLPPLGIHENKEQNRMSSFSIISVGRSHWKKGYRYALQAIKLLVDSHVDVHYTIVGANEDLELLFHINDLKLNPYVTITSKMSNEKVLSCIKSSDLLLLPSVEEGIANVVLEAMALGTLVLSTNCGGMLEVVKNGETGFTVPIRNSKVMADMIFEIINMNNTEKNRICGKAKEMILNNHLQHHMIDQMENLYHHVLNE